MSYAEEAPEGTPPGFHWECLECGHFGPHLEVFTACHLDAEEHAATHDGDDWQTTDGPIRIEGAAFYSLCAGPPPARGPWTPEERGQIALAVLRGMKLRSKQEGGE